jgi:hypothetical protein
MNTFKINDVELRYKRVFFNEAYQNERSIEVAIGEWFLDKHKGDVLEIGAVMPYYGAENHEIVDLADDHPKSKKENALNVVYTGRNVLCISTIEHMMTKEYNNGSDQDSITFLNKVLTNASSYLITWGLGYNPFLDAHMKSHPEIQHLIMRRVNWKNEYVKGDPLDFDVPFGHSDKPIPTGYFNNANAVCIVTNLKELL